MGGEGGEVTIISRGVEISIAGGVEEMERGAKYMSVVVLYIVFLPLSLTNAMSHKCDSCVKPHDIIIVCHGAKSIS